MFLLFPLLIAASDGPEGSAAQLLLPPPGMFECWRPDPISKTCQIIGWSRQAAPGVYDNGAMFSLSRDPPVTVQFASSEEARGGALCGVFRTADVLAGSVRIRGQLVDAAVARAILEGLASAMASMEGEESCTRYVRSGSRLIAKTWINGKYHPENDAEVRWISSSEGYSVVP